MNPEAAVGPATTMLSLTAIRVSDLAKSTEFYTAGCGFETEREFSTADFDAAILRAGPAGIELIATRGAADTPQPGNMFEKLVLNTPDAAALLARACRFGGTEEAPARVLEGFGGVTVAFLRDPDGYRIELVQRPT
ncbi:VOC family protein [Nocardia sp. NPDC003963]